MASYTSVNGYLCTSRIKKCHDGFNRTVERKWRSFTGAIEVTGVSLVSG